ncbi:MAG TPA: Hsp70 family protein [Polyangiaceae bacterium]|jgi:molecular chaperone DnaK
MAGAAGARSLNVLAGASVGIDLGTSNTVVAAVESGRAHALVDDVSRQVLVPSVCAFHPSGTVLVGTEAKRRRLQDPKNTIFSAKRLIGRAWTSREVAQARARLPYELREGKNSSVVIRARDADYTLPEVSAFVLRKAKAIAEASLGRKVDRAVITCPANFDDLQRAATKLAGQLAGIDVLRVLNEPTAAALAYGYGREGQERILVYDFGGGTFDVTLLERSGDLFEVKATGGDMYLGGDDVDAAVAVRIAEGFAAKHFYDPRADRDVFEHVRDAAEELKVRLSTEEQATITLEDVAFGPGGKSLRFDYTMSRAELGALADPLIDRTLRVCRRTLERAAIDLRAIDQVILVGGTTLIPRVRERVTELFAQSRTKIADGVSPFEVVAVGAAIQAYAMTEGEVSEEGARALAALKASRSGSIPPPAAIPPASVPAPIPAPAPIPVPVPDPAASRRIPLSLVAAALAVALLIAWLTVR